MAYNAIPTITTGDVATAAWGNTYLKDNFAAGVPDIFAADGDIAIGTGANAAEAVTAFDGSNLLKRDRGGLEVALSAPGADRILFWDHSATAYAYLTASTNLTISGTNITAAGLANVADDTTPQVGGSAGFDLQAQLLVGNGGSTGVAVSAAGEVTMAAQPAFLVRLNTGTDNVTGDGTDYTVAFDTEEFDQNADFNLGTETFTAPVTGRYRLTSTISMGGITSSHTNGRIQIVISNGNAAFSWNPYAIHNSGRDAGSVTLSILTDMDATDTATVLLDITGGAKVVDVFGSPNHHNMFCGELVC